MTSNTSNGEELLRLQLPRSQNFPNPFLLQCLRWHSNSTSPLTSNLMWFLAENLEARPRFKRFQRLDAQFLVSGEK